MPPKSSGSNDSTATIGDHSAWGSGGIPQQSESQSEAETASRRLPTGLAQRGNFVESHGGKLGDISIYGQDKWARRQRPFSLTKRARRVRLRGRRPKQSNTTTSRLAVMNLALRSIKADLVDCMVALPGQLFCSTQITFCL